MRIAFDHRRGRLASVLIVLGLFGCGKEQSDELALTPVTGTITLDGQPLADADLVFHYKGTAPEGYAGAASRSDADGVFQIKSGGKLGILAGLHAVTVTRSSADQEPEVPKKYGSFDTSDLELKVNSDKSLGYLLELSSQ